MNFHLCGSHSAALQGDIGFNSSSPLCNPYPTSCVLLSVAPVTVQDNPMHTMLNYFMLKK